MFRTTTTIRMLVIGLAVAGAAQAQMYSPGYGTYGAPMSNYLASSYLLQQATLGARSAGSRTANAAPVRDAGALLVRPAAPPTVPRKLAAAYPERARADVEALFLKTLEGYHGIEAKFGIPRYDIGGALAAFVVGNYMAYRNEPFPDAQFMPLVRQMRGAMGQVPALRSADDAQKQELYEQLAILGTYMALTREGLQQRPDATIAANMKSAAKYYLEQVLKIDPARMRITASGLVLD